MACHQNSIMLSMICHQKPLPSFSNTRSMLQVEEQRIQINEQRNHSHPQVDHASCPSALVIGSASQHPYHGGNNAGRCGRGYRGGKGGLNNGHHNYGIGHNRLIACVVWMGLRVVPFIRLYQRFSKSTASWPTALAHSSTTGPSTYFLVQFFSVAVPIWTNPTTASGLCSYDTTTTHSTLVMVWPTCF